MGELHLGELFEVILYARDMEAQVRFYRDVLGLPVGWPAGLDSYSAEHWVTFSAGRITLALHSGGAPPAGTPPRFGFKVTDIAAARAELLARGVQAGAVRSPASGVQVVDCVDPEGNGFFVESNAQ
jgi:catechol 2,3-dioxygenase-like lactoylglutathione lyase family enzyme